MEQTSILFEIADASVHSQVDMVRTLLSQNRWLAPFELQEEIWRTRGLRVSESGISARIRDCRKAEYGAHHVAIRRRSGTRFYEYQIEERRDATQT